MSCRNQAVKGPEVALTSPRPSCSPSLLSAWLHHEVTSLLAIGGWPLLLLLLLLSRFSGVWLCATPQMASYLRPCDSPGKNTGVGCHFLLQSAPYSYFPSLATLAERENFFFLMAITQSDLYVYFSHFCTAWIFHMGYFLINFLILF